MHSIEPEFRHIYNKSSPTTEAISHVTVPEIKEKK